jgi:hypothetical protein
MVMKLVTDVHKTRMGVLFFNVFHNPTVDNIDRYFLPWTALPVRGDGKRHGIGESRTK